MTLFTANRLYSQNYIQIKRGENNITFAFIICTIFALWIGMRPNHFIFGDTYFYTHTYNLMKYNIGGSYEESSEWIWNNLSYACSQIMDVSYYFTIIAIGYFGFTLIACRILTKNNVIISLLFIFGAFSFFSYGTNGIRNGLACSIALSAIALCAYSRKDLIFAIVLAFIAINIHRSTVLPIASLFASIYIVKQFKWAYTFWILSIFISLVAGGTVTAAFVSLGFDDRTSYLTTMDDGMFSHTGFRWDFLIYSMMPIVLGYYVVIKRGIQDRTYIILLNTYTLANAFWVMVIRANYSNRFAYLSWFMYPIVLAYPLLQLNIWGQEQGKRASQIMLAHIGFTWFMETFYW
ncbi:MAG: EpsG family protein [Paramuribaculum sp.]|nr:EpsG family protein [Paramuribaculum sp.]